MPSKKVWFVSWFVVLLAELLILPQHIAVIGVMWIVVTLVVGIVGFILFKDDM